MPQLLPAQSYVAGQVGLNSVLWLPVPENPSRLSIADVSHVSTRRLLRQNVARGVLFLAILPRLAVFLVREWLRRVASVLLPVP